MHKKAQTFGASLTTLCAAAFGLLFAANAAVAQSSTLPKADLQKTATKYEVRGVIPYGRNIRGELTLLGASRDAQAIVDALPVKEPPLDGFRVSIELSEPGPLVHRVVFASDDTIVAVLVPKSDGTYEKLPASAEATIRNPWLTRMQPVRTAAPDKPVETPSPQPPGATDGPKSTSRSMSFEACLSVIQGTSAQLGVAPLNIIETTQVRMVRFRTSNGSVIVTCSRPDQRLVITKSD